MRVIEEKPGSWKDSIETPIQAPFSGVDWGVTRGAVLSGCAGRGSATISAWPSASRGDGDGLGGAQTVAGSPGESLCSTPQRPALGETIWNYSQEVKTGCSTPTV